MNDQEFQKLLDANPPLVLFGAGKKKFIVISAVVFLLMLNGIYMAINPSNPTDAANGWRIAAFFGLLTLFFAASIFTKRIAITLDRDSFTLSTLRRPVSYQWKNVSEFIVTTIATPAAFKAVDTVNTLDNIRSGAIAPVYSSSNMVGNQVFFNSGASGLGADWLRNATGYDSAIPICANFTADQFAELLNYWRERALKNNVE